MSTEEITAIARQTARELIALMPAVQDDKWISAERARQLLGGCSAATLNKLRKEGKVNGNLPADELATGKDVMYTKQSVLEHIERNMKKSKLVKVK
jgi:hypothetical protein